MPETDTEVQFSPDMKLNPRQKLLTAEQYRKLLENGKNPGPHNAGVVKFFGGRGTWIFSEIDEDGIAFGIADLGMGCCEYGRTWLPEMCEPTGRRLPWIERDLHFSGDKPLSAYMDYYNQRQTLAGCG